MTTLALGASSSHDARVQKHLAAVLLGFALIVLGRSSRADDEKKIVLREGDLANGLHVVVDEHARVPLVTVVLSYRVGTMQEPAGRTGLADLTMSLMADHTKHVPPGEMRRELDELATSWGHRSGLDRTTFGATVEPNALERIFWLFSDGMGFFRGAVGQAEVDHRLTTAVKSERSEFDDTIGGLAGELIRQEMYPPNHPYRRSSGDPAAELAGIRVQEIEAFHARWFVPRNASLVVVGAVSYDDVMRLATKWFGTIPAGAPHGRTDLPEAKLGGKVELEVAAPGQSREVSLFWPTPSEYASGDAELDAIAGVLDGDRSARLRWRLDSDKHLVSRISAHQRSAAHGSWFVISATLRPGHTTREVVDEIDALLRDVQSTPVETDDITGAVFPLLSPWLFAMENTQRRAYLYASWLSSVGIASYVEQDVGRYVSLTPDVVQQAARVYLPLDRRVIVTIDPDPTAPMRGTLRRRTFTPGTP